jgi:hypothetical protein
LHDPQLARVDAWLKFQKTKMTRPEAIRRLIDMGLEKARDGSPHPSVRTCASLNLTYADRLPHLSRIDLSSLIPASEPSDPGRAPRLVRVLTTRPPVKERCAAFGKILDLLERHQLPLMA